MPDNSRISGEIPYGAPDENLEYIFKNGGQLKKTHVLQQRVVLQHSLAWPDGTEFPKGFALPAGMMLPKGSIIKVSPPEKEEPEVLKEDVVFEHVPERKDVYARASGSRFKKQEACDDSWVFGGDYFTAVPNIGIIGVGGAGNNTVARIAATGIDCANIYAINTAVGDMKRLGGNVKKGLIGANMTKGLGAGGDYEKGRKAATGDRDKITNMLQDTNLLFLSAGMGGGTGTGAAPVVAEATNSFDDCTTIAVVTFPFDHEGGHRARSARKGIADMRKHADTVVIVDNNRLDKLYGTRTVGDALQKADDIITTAITSIAETISTPQNAINEISLDYADIRTIMKGNGARRNVAVMCLGQGRSIEEAVENTITKPLLDVDYEGATGALIHVIGGPNMKLADTTDIGKQLTTGLKLSPDANVIWGIRVKEDMGENIEVITIFNGIKSPQILGDEYTDWEELPQSALQISDAELGLQSIIQQ
ncbi:hypothetical protein BEH94_05225 [Candidatus Altiarchaeales archaeon WOR_SM1_SCG]|nr:hypothetical protein BEH94_05225 [Candidatus Altiarchaeales archaeon WOR_SM1_SCG]